MRKNVGNNDGEIKYKILSIFYAMMYAYNNYFFAYDDNVFHDEYNVRFWVIDL